jgi:hypothetical protein
VSLETSVCARPATVAYKTQRFVEVAGRPRFLEADIEPRANSRPI